MRRVGSRRSRLGRGAGLKRAVRVANTQPNDDVAVVRMGHPGLVAIGVARVANTQPNDDVAVVRMGHPGLVAI